MVTFDQNGIATPESQVFLQEKINLIVNDHQITPPEKDSKLKDLYNQYGLRYGTFERKGQFRPTEVQSGDKEVSAIIGGSSWGIGFFIFLMLVFWFLGDVDVWVKKMTDVSIIKGVEHLFQYVFGG